MSVELVTGHAGEAHVSSDDMRSFHADIFGRGTYYTGANPPTVTMSDANTVRFAWMPNNIMMQGGIVRCIGTDSLSIQSGTQSGYRHDLVVLRITVDASTTVETASLEVVTGTTASSAAAAEDPTTAYMENNILDGASVVDVPIARITLDGLTPTVEWLLEKATIGIPAMLPAGCIQEYAGSTAPDGWLMCDGSLVSRTTYKRLFEAIGTTYGAGDGSTTFALPNLQGRVPVGVSSSYNLGASGGAETVKLTAAQCGVPAHSHGLNSHTHSIPALSGSAASNGSHTHKTLNGGSGDDLGFIITGNNATNMTPAINSGYGLAGSTSGNWHNKRIGIGATTGSAGAHTHTVTTNASTSGAASGNTANNTAAAASSAHNNMQPYLVLNYIISVGE